MTIKHTTPTFCAFALAALLTACSSGGPTAAGGGSTGGSGGGGNTTTPFWTQFALNAQHTANPAVAGSPLTSILASEVFDPFVAQEQAEEDGVLAAHYQVPLIDGNGDIYMLTETGAYNSCNPPGSGGDCGPDDWASKIWNEQRVTLKNGTMTALWTFPTDWKPEPNGGPNGLGGFEPVFHPALANGDIYIPGAGGTIYQVKTADGSMIAQINPFDSIDANTYVAGPLTADSSGNIYYNAIKLQDPMVSNPWTQSDVQGAWLVKVAKDNTTSLVSYMTLIPGAPAGTDLCETTFNPFSQPLPWPPSNDAVPPSSVCGSQRPGLNVAPAIASDGTIYTVTRAHFNDRYGYMIALNPDLSLKWATSLHGILHDACGVLVPIGTSLDPPTPNACREGTMADGRDPETNDAPSGRVDDGATSSPVVVSDGVLVGTETRYNYFRGHLLKFDASGNFKATYDFGYDITPAIYTSGSSYSIIIKDNNYAGLVGSYCNDPKVCPASGIPRGPFYVTQLDSSLNIQWQFQNTNDQLCQRNSDGSITCVNDPNHPNGWEFCINAPVVDKNGVVYATSEDGFLYSISQGHSSVFNTYKEKIFQDVILGESYNPISIGPTGTIWSIHAGMLYATGGASSSVVRPR